MSSNVWRNILCARLSLVQVLQSYLIESITVEHWPSSPTLHYTRLEKASASLVFVISIDSGTKTTKLMGRFLTEIGCKKPHDALLLGEARGTDESFANLVR